MKKVFLVLMCLLMIISIISCGDDPCSHIDADDNSLCDKCDESYTDGNDIDDSAPCLHRDADDNSLCDKCGESYTDGNDIDDSTPCSHRDADDNSLCDKCGESYTDGNDLALVESTPGLEYIENPDGTYTVTGIGTCTEKDIVIGTYNNRKVTSIGDHAFYYCHSLTSVTIGHGVASIGHYAFRGCTSLTSITIPDGVTSIGVAAFAGCERLTSITIPDSVTNISGGAFMYCERLTSIKYRGTEEKWNAIFKGDNWNYNTGIYTITCNYTGE